jgi:hypothetical protein
MEAKSFYPSSAKDNICPCKIGPNTKADTEILQLKTQRKKESLGPGETRKKRLISSRPREQES